MLYSEIMADNVSKGQCGVSANNGSTELMSVDTWSLGQSLSSLLFHLFCFSYSYLCFAFCAYYIIFHIIIF